MAKSHWRPAFVGVGSNLDSPIEQVTTGISAMRTLPQTTLVLESSRYRSAPLGPTDQPDFINAVVGLLTQLEPCNLLEALQTIEIQHGRKRPAEQWGPRTLDLDLLAYSSLILAEKHLTLPHPRIAERNFVLLPWNEIAPHFPIPGLSTVSELACQVSVDQPTIEKLPEA